MKQVTLNLTQFGPLARWKPQVGDIVFWHGWFTHWFGIINGISEGQATIVKAGLPYLLVAMSEAEISKNQVNIDLAKIAGGSRGKYAVLQITGSTSVWYV